MPSKSDAQSDLSSDEQSVNKLFSYSDVGLISGISQCTQCNTNVTVPKNPVSDTYLHISYLNPTKTKAFKTAIIYAYKSCVRYISSRLNSTKTKEASKLPSSSSPPPLSLSSSKTCAFVN